MATYWEKLKDPRWQKRRLEVMQANGFACENCKAKDKTLNVHHRIYRKNANPWEYTNRELACLCEECHEYDHQLGDAIKEALVYVTDTSSKEYVVGLLDGYLLQRGNCESVSILSYPHLMGIARALGVGDDDLDAISKDGKIHSNDAVELSIRDSE